MAVHAQIQDFFSGGGPGSMPENSLDNVFFYCFFSSSSYFTVYRGGSMVLLQRKLYFSKEPEGVQQFSRGGGGPTFSRGGGQSKS